MDYLSIASHIGILAFAISGIILGIRKEFDMMGVFILSFLTCSGGGILRDVLLNQNPSIFQNQYIFVFIIITIFIFKLLREKDVIDKLEGTFAFRFSDTVGLSAFAVSGAQTAILLELNIFTVAIIAFLTAVGGGIVRDMLVNTVPEILKSGFYGSVAVLIGLFLYSMDYMNISSDISIPLAFTFGILMRIVAIKKDIQLPKI